ncbi:MAG: hypothetical protein U0987_14440, partial [Afipia sp.]|nr:hypothetical protein [Afipia sp.]
MGACAAGVGEAGVCAKACASIKDVAAANKTNDPAAFFVLVMCSPLLQIAFAADIGSTSDGLLFRSFRRLAVFAQ